MELHDEPSSERLLKDLKAVMNDAEDLLKATADEMGDKAREARERLNEALDRAKVSYRHLEGRAKEGAEATDRLIKEHPYESLGVAFGVGLLLGALLTRK